jgi:hypothetical protein
VLYALGMSKRAAVIALLLPAWVSVARADQTTVTENANTVVVVTPNAPIIVGGGTPSQGPQAITPQLGAPGAQDAPAMPAPPQNEDWSNVSNINGVPVKVGERNAYLYDYKKINVTVDPFGAFFGYWDGSVQVGVTRNVAISGSISAGNLLDGNTGVQFTASAPIYFRRTFSGPFLEPGIIVGSESNGCPGNDNWTGPELLFGWQWNFDSGLNIAWALGVYKHLDDPNYDGESSVSPNGYFRVGYNF